MYSLKLLTNISSIWLEEIALRNEAEYMSFNYLSKDNLDVGSTLSCMFPSVICNLQTEMSSSGDMPVNTSNSKTKIDIECDYGVGNQSANKLTISDEIPKSNLVYPSSGDQLTNVISHKSKVLNESEIKTSFNRRLEPIFHKPWKNFAQAKNRNIYIKGMCIMECPREQPNSNKFSPKESSGKKSDNDRGGSKQSIVGEGNRNERTTHGKNKKQSEANCCCGKPETYTCCCKSNRGGGGTKPRPKPVCIVCCPPYEEEYDEDDDDNDWGEPECNRNTCKKFSAKTNQQKDNGTNTKAETRFAPEKKETGTGENKSTGSNTTMTTTGTNPEIASKGSNKSKGTQIVGDSELENQQKTILNTELNALTTGKDTPKQKSGKKSDKKKHASEESGLTETSEKPEKPPRGKPARRGKGKKGLEDD